VTLSRRQVLALLVFVTVLAAAALIALGTR